MAEARSVMQFVHVVAMLVDAQRALELKEGLTHREVTLANGGCPVLGPRAARAAGAAGPASLALTLFHVPSQTERAGAQGSHECGRSALLLPADVVAEGRLLLIVANKLDALTPAQRQQALTLIRQTVEDSLPDARWHGSGPTTWGCAKLPHF